MATLNVLEILRTALDIEHKAHSWYLQASRDSKDPVVSAIFLSLGHDEEEHEMIIPRFYEALESGKGWPHPDGAFTEIRPSAERIRDLFSQLASQALPESFLDTYRAAYDFEVKTRDFYASQFESASEEQPRAFFGFLKKLEEAHVQMLSMLIESTERGTE